MEVRPIGRIMRSGLRAEKEVRAMLVLPLVVALVVVGLVYVGRHRPMHATATGGVIRSTSAIASREALVNTPGGIR